MDSLIAVAITEFETVVREHEQKSTEYLRDANTRNPVHMTAQEKENLRDMHTKVANARQTLVEEIDKYCAQRTNGEETPPINVDDPVHEFYRQNVGPETVVGEDVHAEPIVGILRAHCYMVQRIIDSIAGVPVL